MEIAGAILPVALVGVYRVLHKRHYTLFVFLFDLRPCVFEIYRQIEDRLP
jgi:hypothetical protein